MQKEIKYGSGAITSYEFKSGVEEEERKADTTKFAEEDEEEIKSAAASSHSQQKKHKGAAAAASMEEDFSAQPIARQKLERGASTVIFIIPFGVPGSGKSTIWKKLKERLDSEDGKEWSYASVSSDAIRGELMKEQIKQGKTRK